MGIQQIVPREREDGQTEWTTKSVRSEKFDTPETKAERAMREAERSRRNLPKDALLPRPTRRTAQHAPVMATVDPETVEVETEREAVPIQENLGGGLTRVAKEPVRNQRQRRRTPNSAEDLNDQGNDTDMDSGDKTE